MPQYSYHCTSCGEAFTINHGMQQVLTKCPICHEQNCVSKLPPRIAANPKLKEEMRKTEQRSMNKEEVSRRLSKYIGSARGEIEQQKARAKAREYRR